MLSLIQKSGTGIQKSGTGIGKSGTGAPRMLRLSFLAMLLLLLSGFSFAQSDAGITLSQTDSGLVVSLHDSTGVYVGQAESVADGYYMIPLYSVVSNGRFDHSFETMIHGSGSGAAGESSGGSNSLEYHGSGSGSSGKGVGCGSASLQYHGSGSGSSNSGQSKCRPATGEPLYHGSGSGAAGEAAACARASLQYHGSGSGSAGEQAGACRGLQPWGVVEVAVDDSGASVVVNRLSGAGVQEHVVAFVPSQREILTGHSFSDKARNVDNGSVAIP